MKTYIKDFTPLFTEENTNQQHFKVRNNIDNLLSLQKTHQLLTTGGANLYNEELASHKIYSTNNLEYEIFEKNELASFISTVIAELAESAYHVRKPLQEVAQSLYNFDPKNIESFEKLERNWLDHEILIEELIDLYSEFIYKVYLDNPYLSRPIGLNTSR